MKINESLKLIRTTHRLNQKELANKLAISRSHLSEIESGKANPSIDLLEKYSNYFNVPISTIFLIAEKDLMYIPAKTAA